MKILRVLLSKYECLRVMLWSAGVAVCCSVLQCVAVCCSVLQCATIWVSACIAVICGCCGVMQCVAVCCSVLQCVAVCYNMSVCVYCCDLRVLRCDAICESWSCFPYTNIACVVVGYSSVKDSRFNMKCIWCCKIWRELAKFLIFLSEKGEFWNHWHTRTKTRRIHGHTHTKIKLATVILKNLTYSWPTATHCDSLQLTATHCNTLQQL